MSTEATWVILILTNLFGSVLIFVVLYYLKSSKSKRRIRTFSDPHKKEEKGPSLELPDGVILPDDQAQTRA